MESISLFLESSNEVSKQMILIFNFNLPCANIKLAQRSLDGTTNHENFIYFDANKLGIF